MFAHRTFFHNMLFFCVCLIQHCVSCYEIKVLRFGAISLPHASPYIRACLCRKVHRWLFMYSCSSDVWCLWRRRLAWRGGGHLDPLEKLNWVYWISDPTISIIYRQDGQAVNYSFIQVKNTELHLSVSPAASPHLLFLSVLPSLIFPVSAAYFTPAACVCLSSARGALHPAMTMK